MAAGLVGAAFAVLSALSLAVQSLAIRLGTKTHRVTDVVAVMFAVNLVVLVPATVLTATPRTGLTTTAVGAFAISGLLGSLLARFFYFGGIARIGASRAEPLKALFPVFAVAVAVLVLRERVTPRLLAGAAFLVLGGLGVAAETRSNPGASRERPTLVDVGFPLVAALLLGIDPIFTKIGLAEGTTALLGLTVRIAAAAAAFAPYVAWRLVRSDPGSTVPDLNGWLLVAGVANTAYLISYYAALDRAPVAVVTPLLGLSTLFVVGGSAAFLQRDEHVTWRLAGVAVLVVVGAVIVVQA